ncbi:hypothetical protein CYLTODRAFT_142659 [Cylindrobasidium torrendii FP15055 ss-10]|uniref:Uncharacterized protein n=1 Tax=Cylindrobasidium torrendii FP15055 ss-10 TaxID=1314674 RepID=A0A0D7AZG3_9AGAR|nr:hypothetical protein CYLTODRAFT_142659 [Cylindrobasidium torrendii FP15055 ss-10]
MSSTRSQPIHARVSSSTDALSGESRTCGIVMIIIPSCLSFNSSRPPSLFSPSRRLAFSLRILAQPLHIPTIHTSPRQAHPRCLNPIAHPNAVAHQQMKEGRFLCAGATDAAGESQTESLYGYYIFILNMLIYIDHGTGEADGHDLPSYLGLSLVLCSSTVSLTLSTSSLPACGIRDAQTPCTSSHYHVHQVQTLFHLHP